MLGRFKKILVSTLGNKAAADSVAARSRELRQRGNDHLAAGRLGEAEQCYRAALAADGNDADTCVSLGYTLCELGHDGEAAEVLQRALGIEAANADAHYMLGGIRERAGDMAGAAAHFTAAVESRPAFNYARRDLCRALFETGQKERAKEVILRGLALDPACIDFHYYLGNLHLEERELVSAVACYRKVLELQPDHAGVYANLGQAAIEQGDLDAAVDWYRKACALAPDSADAISGLLFASSAHPHSSPDAYLAQARRYGEDMTARARPFTEWPAAMRDTPPPLRVGLVSGDLRHHPVGFFLESILRHLSPDTVQLHAYPTRLHEDDLTARIRPHFAAWTPIAGLSDEAAAQRIHRDGIHVLVDLAGHTGHNRLPVFAWKPAPVQVTWLGYFATTGLPAIDYLLADAWSVPASHRAHFTETIHYLPDTRLCFTAPSAEDALPPAPPPALRNGHVTFGCFQNLTKVHDDVLRLWGRVLRAVPGSRLWLQSKQTRSAEVRDDLMRRLVAAGIDGQRVTIHAPLARTEYLAGHANVDILLDTFPYPGGTTTCEALWMGVPTLTLAGSTLLSSQGAAIIGCAGLQDWIARDEDDYVTLAVRHAFDIDRLAQLRSGLRGKVARSPLFDALRFAAHLEHALLNMWREKQGDGHRRRGNALLAEGRLEEAARSYAAALESVADNVDARIGLGYVLLEQHRDAEATAVLSEALALAPGHADAAYMLATLCERRGDLRQAAAHLDTALASRPDFGDAWRDLCRVLFLSGDKARANEAARKALAIDPESADAHYYLGNLYSDERRYDLAVDCYGKALSLRPDYAQVMTNLGLALHFLGKPDEAAEHHRGALRIAPDNAEAHCNLGMALQAQGKTAEAIASFRHAEALAPDFAEAHWNESLSLLLCGDLAAGWEKYEWRWKNPQLRAAKDDRGKTAWSGNGSLKGKTVLLRAEQGFGDTIQFCRYAAQVAERGANVLLEVQSPLKSLLAGLRGVRQVFAEGEALPDFDCYCYLLGLPRAFGTTLASIPAQSPYIDADPETTRRWTVRLGERKRPRVGLVWSGRPTHTNDRNRSIALADLVAAMPEGADLISLQKEVRPADEPALHCNGRIIHFSDIGDFADTAGLVANLDLVISVDTSVAHLAAAMGRPTWILLPFMPDWRWLLERRDTPWYPSVRLFRQSRPAHWDDAFAALSDELRSFLASGPGPAT
jgi:predicted O-linked N-acetylglucosamine transferase (SPINDLY family)